MHSERCHRVVPLVHLRFYRLATRNIQYFPKSSTRVWSLGNNFQGLRKSLFAGFVTLYGRKHNMTLGSPVRIHVTADLVFFFMVHVDGWYIIMFPSIFCAFSPLKEKRVQEDPDATVSNGLMVRQANWVKRNCYWMNFYRKNPQGSWNYPFLLETMRRYGEVEGFSLDSGLIWINWVCNIYWPLIAIFGKVGTP